MSDAEGKQCRTCGEVRPLGDFYGNSRSHLTGYRYPDCKACYKRSNVERDRRRYHTDPVFRERRRTAARERWRRKHWMVAEPQREEVPA